MFDHLLESSQWVLKHRIWWRNRHYRNRDMHLIWSLVCLTEKPISSPSLFRPGSTREDNSELCGRQAGQKDQMVPRGPRDQDWGPTVMANTAVFGDGKSAPLKLSTYILYRSCLPLHYFSHWNMFICSLQIFALVHKGWWLSCKYMATLYYVS